MSGTVPGSQVTAAIAAYRPASVSDGAGRFARCVVGASKPQSTARARALLLCASRIAAFGESVGLELCPEALLVGATIERFVLIGCHGLSPATRRTLRANLRALARALQMNPEPAPTPLGRERAKAPYSDAEISGYLRLAAAQGTEARRMRCAALLCLGAGAGIVAGELRHVRGGDVAERSGGLVVEVRGARARAVPVLTRFHVALLAAARFAGEGYIAGGRDCARRNLTDTLCAALSADPALGRLQSGRLRSTWLRSSAQAIGLGAFMAAAGVSCSQRLGDIAASLPRASEQEMVALLGGSP